MSQIPSAMPLDETKISSLPEPLSIPEPAIEESDQVPLTSSSLSTNTHRSNSFPSDNINILNENSSNTQTIVECLPNNESSDTTMVIVTSPLFNSDLSSEQNESNDKINSSSVSFLQTKQRRIDHRRNKSEPFKSASIDDLSSTTVFDTTTNESPLSNNSLDENKRKSSLKTLSNNISSLTTTKQLTQEKSSSSSTTTKKKKVWYNVSKFCLLFF